ncbi:MAG TPA: hypothetical protein DDW52_01020, partial [Planctomycetaceae bacterium]|nr:hypothetical protein [Planctomycetaceae bacterium]
MGAFWLLFIVREFSQTFAAADSLAEMQQHDSYTGNAPLEHNPPRQPPLIGMTDMNSRKVAFLSSGSSCSLSSRCDAWRVWVWLTALLVLCEAKLVAQDACPPITRRLPAPGKVKPSEEDLKKWESQIAGLSQRLASAGDIENIADAGVLLKSAQLAIRFGEFYRASDFRKMDRVIELAGRRVEQAEQSRAVTVGESGLQVRGFRSRVDGSYQPVGLELPSDLQSRENVPLVVWLHGRGDSKTDLHFICERLDKAGQFKMPEAIVLHPFGRQCVGYKSAGETDVLEAIDFVCEEYPVDPERIVLMGFSMGGAGVWHLAAHYTDRFVGASPGAGFAETARYQRLTPAQFPPKYEQILWGVYDVPGYVRNLFNIPVVAYSGENDKQIQAARVMEEAYREHERILPHLIGPGMGHKYHPDTLAEITARMRKTLNEARPRRKELYLQTQHLRYATRRWIEVTSQFEQYADTRVDATLKSGVWQLETHNVSKLSLSADDESGPGAADTVRVDEQEFVLGEGGLRLVRASKQSPWQEVDEFQGLFKLPGLSGPIDDAFLDPFLIVTPDAADAGGP